LVHADPARVLRALSIVPVTVMAAVSMRETRPREIRHEQVRPAA